MLDARKRVFVYPFDGGCQRQEHFYFPPGNVSLPRDAFWGLKSTSAVYMNLMDIVLQGLQSFALVYIDDILIFTKGDKQHVYHIQVFDRFRQHKLAL